MMRPLASVIAAMAMVALSLIAVQAQAGQTNVAVAANFTAAAKAIAAAFTEKTGHDAVLSFGSTGQLYAQITQGAPFEVFLAADDEHPKKLVEEGLAVAESRFTYALGTLVLWSRNPALVTGAQTLESGAFRKLAIANPDAAPYGAAAVAALKALGVYDALRPKLVAGANVSQAFQFIDTGNAELGFIALSQIAGTAHGSRWQVPQDLYPPIRQDAVLLKTGADNAAARAFVGFLNGPEARATLIRFGYAADSSSAGRNGANPG